MAAGDIPRDRIHGPRSVKRDHGDDILKALRLQLHERLLHATRLQLENTVRPSLADQAVGRGIIKRNAVKREIGMTLLNIPFRIGKDGQIAESEEVKFNKTEGGIGIHVVLGNDRIPVHRKRHVVSRWLFGNDKPRRMGGGVARHPLQCTRGTDQMAHLGRALIQRRKLLPLERILDGHVERLRNEACHTVYLGIRHIERTANVAHGGTRRHRSEGGDLRHVVGSVFFLDVCDDLLASLVTEIDIKIGEGHTLGVQKALKEQIVAQGINVGDPDAVGHKASRPRATPGPHGDPLSLRVADEIAHDQKIGIKAHL